jgi:hypothetical protein
MSKMSALSSWQMSGDIVVEFYLTLFQSNGVDLHSSLVGYPFFGGLGMDWDILEVSKSLQSRNLQSSPTVILPGTWCCDLCPHISFEDNNWQYSHTNFLREN